VRPRVPPRLAQDRCSTTRPTIMVRMLGCVDGFGDNGAPISGRQTFRFLERPSLLKNSRVAAFDSIRDPGGLEFRSKSCSSLGAPNCVAPQFDRRGAFFNRLAHYGNHFPPYPLDRVECQFQMMQRFPGYQHHVSRCGGVTLLHEKVALSRESGLASRRG